jgi:hypothetical protein
MKQAFVSAVVAALVSIATWQFMNARSGAEPSAAATALPVFRVTDELIEDGWVARAPGSDAKPLAPASSSICYLTKIEIKGIQKPEDANSCAIGVDDFTGYWQVTAAIGEGGQSEVRCNARCLVWGEEKQQ